MLIDACVLVTCCVVARQYSAVLRMLQIRHSSSIVNLAASDPSFSFSRLLMVRPPLLVQVLQADKHKHGYQRTRTQPSSPPRWKKQKKDCMETTRQLLKNKRSLLKLPKTIRGKPHKATGGDFSSFEKRQQETPQMRPHRNVHSLSSQASPQHKHPE